MSRPNPIRFIEREDLMPILKQSKEGRGVQNVRDGYISSKQKVYTKNL